MTVKTAISVLKEFDNTCRVSSTSYDSEYLLTCIRASDNYFHFLISESGLAVSDLLKIFQDFKLDFELKLIHSDLKLEVIDTHASQYSDVIDFVKDSNLNLIVPESEFIEPYLTTFEFNYSGMRLDNRGSGYPNS